MVRSDEELMIWLIGLVVFGMFVAVAVAHALRPAFDLSVLLVNR